MVIRLLVIMASLTLTLHTAPSATAQDFEKGMAAFRRGDVAVARREWQPLAERGDLAAQFYLGMSYLHARRSLKDSAEGLKWLRHAAGQGYALAQKYLGFAYRNGIDVEKSDTEAMRWYRMAAEQGNAGGQAALASLFDKIGDYPEAFRWRLKAAEQADGGAAYGLGEMYRKGQGVPQDYVKAYMWMSIAISRRAPNIPGIVSRRDAIAQRMTAAQVDEARKLATAWLEKHQK